MIVHPTSEEKARDFLGKIRPLDMLQDAQLHTVALLLELLEEQRRTRVVLEELVSGPGAEGEVRLMPYSTQTDMEGRVPATKITELCKPATPTDIVPGLIDEADGVIDLYNTQTWTAAQKMGCSRSLAIEMLFSRHGTGKVPTEHKNLAKDWKDRLDKLGLRAASKWFRVAKDPALQETAAELRLLRTGD